jgi:hypothetical protein
MRAMDAIGGACNTDPKHRHELLKLCHDHTLTLSVRQMCTLVNLNILDRVFWGISWAFFNKSSTGRNDNNRIGQDSLVKLFDILNQLNGTVPIMNAGGWFGTSQQLARLKTPAAGKQENRESPLFCFRTLFASKRSNGPLAMSNEVENRSQVTSVGLYFVRVRISPYAIQNMRRPRSTAAKNSVLTLSFSARITSRSRPLTTVAKLILQPVSKFRAATYVKHGTQSCNLKLNFRIY